MTYVLGKTPTDVLAYLRDVVEVLAARSRSCQISSANVSTCEHRNQSSLAHVHCEILIKRMHVNSKGGSL